MTAVREPPPTYREVVAYDNVRQQWVFDPHWLRWLSDQTMAIATIVTDHGSLTGLGDDDHPQYFDTTRGDARYATLSGLAATIAQTSLPYAPGSFSIATGRYIQMAKNLTLTGTQRGTLVGTARLRIN